MRASCSDEAGLGVARSPSPITSTALETRVARLHRFSSATGKRAFDVAQRNSALGQRTNAVLDRHGLVKRSGGPRHRARDAMNLSAGLGLEVCFVDTIGSARIDDCIVSSFGFIFDKDGPPYHAAPLVARRRCIATVPCGRLRLARRNWSTTFQSGNCCRTDIVPDRTCRRRTRRSGAIPRRCNFG